MISLNPWLKKSMTFEQFLIKAIDEEFSILGEKCKKALYFHLKDKFELNGQDISYRIKDFSYALEDIFGIGAKVLQIRIMKNIYRKMDRSFLYICNQQTLEFNKYLQAAKENKEKLENFNQRKKQSEIKITV
jgi:hypothetical protein